MMPCKHLVILIIVGAVALAYTPVQGQVAKQLVAIPNFLTGGELSSDAGEELADLLTGQLNPQRFKLVPRSAVTKWISPAECKRLLQESATYIEQLKRASFDWLVLGKVYGRMGAFSLTYRVISVRGHDFRDSLMADNWARLLEKLMASFKGSPLYVAIPLTPAEPTSVATPPVHVPAVTRTTYRPSRPRVPVGPIDVKNGLYVYRFNVDRDWELVDKIRYDYQVYVGGKPLNFKHFDKENRNGQIFFVIRVPKETKSIRVYAGYRYGEFQLDRLRRVRFLSLIDGHKLLDHLKRIAQKPGNGEYRALGILEYLLLTKRKVMKKLSDEELDALSELALSWRFEDEGTKRQRRKVVEALDRLRYEG